MAAILYDVNALIYWCFVGSPKNYEVSAMTRRLIERGDALLVAASTLNETYYTLIHHCEFSEPEAREALRLITKVFEVAPVDCRIVQNAIDSNEPDYEDAVVRACAEDNEVDAILSYDRRALTGSRIPRVVADEVE